MSFFSEIDQRRAQYEDLAAQTVELALKKGADQAKIKIGTGKGINVSARDGEVENLEFNQMLGMAVRVYRDHHTASVSTNDFSPESIANAIDSALNLCDYTSPDEFAGLCYEADLYQGEVTVQNCYALEEDPDAVVKRAIEFEQLGIAKLAQFKDQGLVKSDGSMYSIEYDLDILATSHGFCRSKAESSVSKYIGFVGMRDGVMQTGSSGQSLTNPAKEWSDERLVDEAIERTLGKLGARKVKTGKYNVIFRRAAPGFISSCLSGLAGNLIYQNSSYLKDKLGEQIYPEFITIKEDPWLKDGLCSSAFDSDGVATRPLTLVENGVLKEYLLGTYSARKLNLRCNGHNDSLYNTFVTANAAHTCSLEEMMARAGSGIVIDGLMGQGVNVVNGNYSRGLSGFYFENGQRVHAVDEVTVAGNMLELTRAIALIGSDVDERRYLQVGSILIPEVTISGD